MDRDSWWHTCARQVNYLEALVNLEQRKAGRFRDMELRGANDMFVRRPGHGAAALARDPRRLRQTGGGGGVPRGDASAALVDRPPAISAPNGAWRCVWRIERAGVRDAVH